MFSTFLARSEIVPVAFDFWPSAQSQSHSDRAKAILAAHPQVRQLIGRNLWTALIGAGVVVLQVAVAAGFGVLGLSWWPLALIAAWCLGAFANHCLYVIIHDASHDLIFQKRNWNKIFAIFADLPNIAPSALSFRSYHLKHHAHLGHEASDADVPSEWEMRLVGNSSVRKAVWLFLFPVIQVLRTLRVGGSDVFDRWALLNTAINIAFAIAVAQLLGGGALLYLFASFWFSISFHPLGGRWIQEHFTLDPTQETSSYYGPLNVVALNMGYHNEHHDLPSIPWNRLPRLKAAAPELYASRLSYSSWAALVWQFVTDKRFSLASRVVRG
jgi:sphingolipid delta-4 desaturase